MSFNLGKFPQIRALHDPGEEEEGERDSRSPKAQKFKRSFWVPLIQSVLQKSKLGPEPGTWERQDREKKGS
ncbi:hypothetical protein ACJ72_08084 [Emergomyces africanus]|uniref:Uncharacterized protein n=1 Tax=Emergomyces africanus TaxID=1955775 RepID=A0A1B7NLE8_9EURO|nr:hypothetical protein ACJ72_08084 [Emergomyces africanus]